MATKKRLRTTRSRSVLIRSTDELIAYVCARSQRTSFRQNSRKAEETSSSPTCLRLDQAYSENKKRITAKTPTAA